MSLKIIVEGDTPEEIVTNVAALYATLAAGVGALRQQQVAKTPHKKTRGLPGQMDLSERKDLPSE